MIMLLISFIHKINDVGGHNSSLAATLIICNAIRLGVKESLSLYNYASVYVMAISLQFSKPCAFRSGYASTL